MFCVGRGKKKCYGKKKRQRFMVEKYCYNKILMKLSWGRENEGKRRQKNSQT
jgi:hypothetical protein